MIGLKELIVILGVSSIGFAAASTAVGSFETSQELREVVAGPTITLSPSPSPTFDKPTLPPLEVEEEPDLTPTSTPTPTPIVTPTPSPSPSPFCLKPKILKGKKIGWIKTNRVCIGRNVR